MRSRTIAVSDVRRDSEYSGQKLHAYLPAEQHYGSAAFNLLSFLKTTTGKIVFPGTENNGPIHEASISTTWPKPWTITR